MIFATLRFIKSDSQAVNKFYLFRNMETLLAKFRIDFEEVIILTDIAKKADTSTAMEFDELVEGMNVSDEELHLEREKTNR